MKLTDVPLQARTVAKAVKQFTNDDERQKDLLGRTYKLGDPAVSPLQMRVRTRIQENSHWALISTWSRRHTRDLSRARSISAASSLVHVPIRWSSEDPTVSPASLWSPRLAPRRRSLSTARFSEMPSRVASCRIRLANSSSKPLIVSWFIPIVLSESRGRERVGDGGLRLAGATRRRRVRRAQAPPLRPLRQERLRRPGQIRRVSCCPDAHALSPCVGGSRKVPSSMARRKVGSCATRMGGSRKVPTRRAGSTCLRPAVPWASRRGLSGTPIAGIKPVNPRHAPGRSCRSSARSRSSSSSTLARARRASSRCASISAARSSASTLARSLLSRHRCSRSSGKGSSISCASYSLKSSPRRRKRRHCKTNYGAGMQNRQQCLTLARLSHEHRVHACRTP